MIDHKVHNKLIKTIRTVFSPFSKCLKIEKENVGHIQVFSRYSPGGKKDRHKIALADMLLIGEHNEPILIIEPETSSSPKTFGRAIAVYSMADEIVVEGLMLEINKPLLLLVVIPDHGQNIQDVRDARTRLDDIQKKMQKLIAVEGSRLKDIAICQIADFRNKAVELLQNNGYSSLAKEISRETIGGGKHASS